MICESTMRISSIFTCIQQKGEENPVVAPGF